MKLYFLLMIFIYSCRGAGKQVFRPIHVSNGNYVYGSESLTPEFKKGIKCVFAHYQISYTEMEDKIYIQPQEEELLRNYTAKALDTSWLQKSKCY